MQVARLSGLSPDRLFTQETFLILISVTGGVDPRAIVRPEGWSPNESIGNRTRDLPTPPRIYLFRLIRPHFAYTWWRHMTSLLDASLHNHRKTNPPLTRCVSLKLCVVRLFALILHCREAPCVRYDVLRPVGMKNTEFWKVKWRSPAKIYQRAAGTTFSLYQTMGRTTLLPNHLYLVVSYSYCLKKCSSSSSSSRS
jgi:hypothetical protein